MALELSGYALKQFFDDPAFWTGHEAYEAVVFTFSTAPSYVDLGAVPDDAVCRVEGGRYLKPGQAPEDFEALLTQWARGLAGARVSGIIPLEQFRAIQDWLATQGMKPLPGMPCKA